MIVVTSVGVRRTDNAIAVALAARPYQDRSLWIIGKFALLVEYLL